MTAPAGPAAHPPGNALRLFAVAILGCAISLAVYQAMLLETRWIIVIFVAVAAVAASMCLARIFSDFLLVVAMFSLSFATFAKWSSGSGGEFQTNAVAVGGLGIGLIDFLLVGLYASWFYRVFITREQPAPRLNLLDGFVLWFLLAHLLASIGSKDPETALGATEFVFKHVLFYFYFSRHFEERHLPWLLGAFAFAIVLGVGLGSIQFATGKLVGIAVDRGGGGALNFQMSVPGTEGYHRATGTSYDAHQFGHFMAFLAPFPLVLCFTPGVRRLLKLWCMAGTIGALAMVLLSMSRSAWLGMLIAGVIGIVMMVAIWRERQIVPALAAAIIIAALATPFFAGFAYDRFANSPHETLSLRYGQYAVAWKVFTLFPLFGIGPGNWLWVFPRYDFIWMPPDEVSRKLVHNVLLWTAVELGIFGFIAYVGILATSMLRLFALVRRRRDIAARMALAALIGIMASSLNNLTEPGYREPISYLTFWLVVSLSVALPRFRAGAGDVLMTPRRALVGAAPTPRMLGGEAAGLER